MLRTNVVSANAAKPSGPGSATLQPAPARASAVASRAPFVGSRRLFVADSIVTPSVDEPCARQAGRRAARRDAPSHHFDYPPHGARPADCLAANTIRTI